MFDVSSCRWLLPRFERDGRFFACPRMDACPGYGFVADIVQCRGDILALFLRIRCGFPFRTRAAGSHAWPAASMCGCMCVCASSHRSGRRRHAGRQRIRSSSSGEGGGGGPKWTNAREAAAATASKAKGMYVCISGSEGSVSLGKRVGKAQAVSVRATVLALSNFFGSPPYQPCPLTM